MAPWVSRWFFSAVIEGVQEVLVHARLRPAALSRRRGRRSAARRDRHQVADQAGRRPAGRRTSRCADKHRSSRCTSCGCRWSRSGRPSRACAVSWSTTSRSGGRRPSILLDLGHRRIAFFGDDLEETHGFPCASDRHRGYDLTLREAGIEPDPDLVQRTGFSIDGGEAAVHRVFGPTASAELPTAIFAVSDEVAMGVLYAARDTGLEGAEGPVRRRCRRSRLRVPVRPDDGHPAGPGSGPDRGPAAPGAGRARRPRVRRRWSSVSATLVRRRSPPDPDLAQRRLRVGAAPGGRRSLPSSGRKSNGQKVSRLRSGSRAEPLAPAEVAVPPLSAERGGRWPCPPRRFCGNTQPRIAVGSRGRERPPCPSPLRRPTQRCSIAPRRAASPTRRSTSRRRSPSTPPSRGFAEAGSDGILQASTGGAEFASGTSGEGHGDRRGRAGRVHQGRRRQVRHHGRAAHRPLPEGQARHLRQAADRDLHRARQGRRPAAVPVAHVGRLRGTAGREPEDRRGTAGADQGGEHHPRDRGRRRRRRGGRGRRRDQRQALHLAGRLHRDPGRAGPAGEQLLHRRGDLRQRARRLQAGRGQAAAGGAQGRARTRWSPSSACRPARSRSRWCSTAGPARRRRRSPRRCPTA